MLITMNNIIHRANFTREHPLSSFGRPVIVMEDDSSLALGPDDVKFLNAKIETENRREMEILKTFGFM